MLAGVSVSAVKIRLHRARKRLRLQLIEAEDRLGESTSKAAMEVPMIEVTVYDVMLRAPKDDPEAEWLPGAGKKYKLGFTRVMLLKERAGDYPSDLGRCSRGRFDCHAPGWSLNSSSNDLGTDGKVVGRRQDHGRKNRCDHTNERHLLRDDMGQTARRYLRS